MGASQGKSKKEQKEEALLWAETKDTEITTLYGENTKLINEMRLFQVDFQAMKGTIEQQQRILENMSKENAEMSRRFEEKLEEQQRIVENMSKENAANCERKSPRRVYFEDENKGEQGVTCCPNTEEAHEAELQRMFDEEWELVLSSHAVVFAQMRYMPGGKLQWAMLDEKGTQATTLLQQYGGFGSLSIEEMRRQIFDVNVKFNKELFKFEGNHFRSVAKALFKLRGNFAFMGMH